MLLGPEAPLAAQALLSSPGPARPPRTCLHLIQEGGGQVLRRKALWSSRRGVGPVWVRGCGVSRHTLPAHAPSQRLAGTQQSPGWGFTLLRSGSSDHEVIPVSPPNCYPFPEQQGTKAAPHNSIILFPDSQTAQLVQPPSRLPTGTAGTTGLRSGRVAGPSVLFHRPGCPGSACLIDSQEWVLS